MQAPQKPRLTSRSARKNWLLRYGLAVAMFASVVVLSIALESAGLKLNLTIPIVFALVATAWYGGRGPGLLISLLFQATTIAYVPIPPDSNLAKAMFGWISVFSLYVFLTLVISGLRTVLQRLREQRDLLHLTLASIGDAVLTTDDTGHVTFMNPVARHLTGWPEDKAIGVPLHRIVHLIDEHTRKEIAGPAEEVFETGGRSTLTNHSLLISRDGTEVPISRSAAPIKNRGSFRGTVVVISDVTAAKVAERARREEEIMRSIVHAQEAERNRIARDLHDHLGQRMTALRLRIESLSSEHGSKAELEKVIKDLQRSAANIDQDIGFLSWELRPTELEQLGLADAVRSYVREWSGHYGINAEFHATRDTDGAEAMLDRETETNLYRIVQEALNNILKHAQASSATVLFNSGQDELSIVIEDNGRGFASDIHTTDPGRPGGFGLVGMQERAAALKGTLQIESQPGEGTSIMVRVPIHRLSS